MRDAATTLRITTDDRPACPRCQGSGRVKAPKTLNPNGRLLPGAGHPIPCPQCRGAGAFQPKEPADA